MKENLDLRLVLIKMMCVGDEIKMVGLSPTMHKLTIMSLPYTDDCGKKYIKANNRFIEIKDLFEYKGELYIFYYFRNDDRKDRYKEFINFVDSAIKNGKSRT